MVSDFVILSENKVIQSYKGSADINTDKDYKRLRSMSFFILLSRIT